LQLLLVTLGLTKLLLAPITTGFSVSKQALAASSLDDGTDKTTLARAYNHGIMDLSVSKQALAATALDDGTDKSSLTHSHSLTLALALARAYNHGIMNLAQTTEKCNIFPNSGMSPVFLNCFDIH
jgi:hypothetical protein